MKRLKRNGLLSVMLNLFQHLVPLPNKTLKQVRGDKRKSLPLRLFTFLPFCLFILLCGCSSVSVKEPKQELVAIANDLWRKYHCITVDNGAINREFGKWDDFVKEIIKSDYSPSKADGKRSVSLARKINNNPKKAKEGGYYDDYKNTIVIPYKVTFPVAELKEALRFALLDRKLETISKIQKTVSRGGFQTRPYMEEYRTLCERINPEHVDTFGDNSNEYSEDELRTLITYMDEKYQDESASIEYNRRFFQDALDHELGHFFLDDVEEGGIGLLYDKRYEGPTSGEILDYVYNRFKDSSRQKNGGFTTFIDRLSEIYAPVTWCHALEGYNPPNASLLKGGMGGIRELIEYVLKQRTSYRLYMVANYDSSGIAWHVGALCFLGIDEGDIVDINYIDKLPPYFVPYNGQIFFNPVRKEIVSVGAGLPRPYKMAEIRKAEVYLREYEKVLLKQELFVRMVDALMSVSLKDDSEEKDFSETNYDLKPLLNEADLEIFKRMKFMGKPMFQKAVEKYRLGLQLLKNGYSPEKIRKELEYATHYVYKGKEYFWQDNGFKIIGEVPFLSSE
ncbi:MAG: hypothetical protein HY354_03270 [Planctomycetes bacterium]|nr:hypothetical protein [Planctomycetota bacterium]